MDSTGFSLNIQASGVPAFPFWAILNITFLAHEDEYDFWVW